MDKGHLSQKAISEEALVPLRKVRICLAKLTKDGLVHLQEVSVCVCVCVCVREKVLFCIFFFFICRR